MKPEITIIATPVTLPELEPLAKAWYQELIKGVADVERGIIALGGEWHMDANQVLIADGSEQKNIWGFNIYPEKRGDDAIEYNSLINIRPAMGHKTMTIEDTALRRKVRATVGKLLPELKL